VSFSEAIYDGSITIEGVEARRAENIEDAISLTHQGIVAVLADPAAESRIHIKPHVLVDARMIKQAPDLGKNAAPLVVGMGPGFIAGENCDAVVETKRGGFMGHLYWKGSAEEDTGQPDPIGDRQKDRVLRSPCDGIFLTKVNICSVVETGQLLAEVNGCPIHAMFHGILRGLLHTNVNVSAGVKVGDIDPRLDPELCTHISDKALAVGGAVVEAILSCPELRTNLCI
jgi:xanthine dehydrogenase accessory factor